MRKQSVSAGQLFAAIAGIFVVAALDVLGILSTEGAIKAGLFYGVGGAGGGCLMADRQINRATPELSVRDKVRAAGLQPRTIAGEIALRRARADDMGRACYPDSLRRRQCEPLLGH